MSDSSGNEPRQRRWSDGNGRSSRLFYWTTVILVAMLSSSISTNVLQARYSTSLQQLKDQMAILEKDDDSTKARLAAHDSRLDVDEQVSRQVRMDLTDALPHIKGVFPHPVGPDGNN